MRHERPPKRAHSAEVTPADEGEIHGDHGDQGGPGRPEAPERNKFLDFATAPLQALGIKGGNQNDRNYDRYLQATQAGNAMKGY